MGFGLTMLLASALAQDPTPPVEVPPEELPILEMPQVLKHVEAPYPPAAKEAGLQGTVLLLIEIDEAGTVVNAEVLQPIGNGFDEAALEAVKQMTFTPAKTEAGPVPVAFEFNYGFLLQTEIVETTDVPAETAPSVINLDGSVREMGTRRKVQGAKVLILAEGFESAAETDADGHFDVRGVPNGVVTVRIVSPGHVVLDKKVEIVEGQVTTANLWIRAEAYRENELVGLYRKEEEEVTRRTISIEEIRQIPGTFGDPVKVVQTLPGAARSPFGTGFLIIRGSNPEDSGVYVDGVRIPIIYHLTGTTSVLSPELIESVDYLPGGYGVQYGRSMGGVVDIRTKRKFEKNKIVWGTDILDSQLYFEGNVGKKTKHGLAIGARRSYIDLFIPLFVGDDFSIKPVYWDYQLKWIPPLGEDKRFSAFVYGFDDLLTVSTPDDVAQGPDQDTQGDFLTRYSSHRLVMDYEQDFSDQLTLKVTPSLGVDFGEFGLGGDFTLKSRNFLAEVRAELQWKPTPAVEVVPGMDFIGGPWGFEFKSPFRFTDLDDPLAERQSVAFSGKGSGWAPDFYVKANFRPLKDRDRWVITPGVRASSVINVTTGEITGGEESTVYSSYAIDPRLSSRFSINDHFTLKASSGLYQQPPQPQELIGVGTKAAVGFERSWSSSFGIEHQISPAIQWDLEGFYKDMDQLIVFNEAWQGFGDINFLNEGEGRSYGLELILRHVKTKHFFGWISYTFSRSIRRDKPEDQWYSFDFDQPHIFSAQGGYDLPFDITVSAQVQYVSGNPTTPFNAGVYDVDGDFYNPFTVGDGYNSDRMPPFFQTSLRVDKLWTFKTWQLGTYVDFLNVVRGVNPEFTIYDYDYSEHAYIRGLPFIPNVGIEAKFYP